MLPLISKQKLHLEAGSRSRERKDMSRKAVATGLYGAAKPYQA